MLSPALCRRCRRADGRRPSGFAQARGHVRRRTSSTCSLAWRLRAWRWKISRISAVRSSTVWAPVSVWMLRACDGETSWSSRTTVGTSRLRTSVLRSCSFPGPRYAPESNEPRRWVSPFDGKPQRLGEPPELIETRGGRIIAVWQLHAGGRRARHLCQLVGDAPGCRGSRRRPPAGTSAAAGAASAPGGGSFAGAHFLGIGEGAGSPGRGEKLTHLRCSRGRWRAVARVPRGCRAGP